MNSKRNMNIGYKGYQMSKNADLAHKMGQFPVSKITSKLLISNGFEYSLSFFRWLCQKNYIKPVAWHHTSAACNMTAFYSISTITYVAEKFNLSLLYRIYSGAITKEEAKRELGIQYVKAYVVPSALGFNISSPLLLDLVKYDNFYYLSKDKKLILNERQIDIIKLWDETPSQGWTNKNNEIIIRMLLTKKKEYV
ncbi:MAG: hypothetical protein K0R34_3603 [Herbinix sp.]|jgi:hypothetical protein|nr:hypothetical protein [Herbinix sp.]